MREIKYTTATENTHEADTANIIQNKPFTDGGILFSEYLKSIIDYMWMIETQYHKCIYHINTISYKPT